jgi:predicted porin
MKTSIIGMAALAAAGMASAQSSVTLFGLVDATISLGRGSVSDKTQLTNSGNLGSRLGFRGTEDLGGGMSASFWLEAGLNNDNGAGAATNTNNQANGGALTGMAGGQGLTFNRRSTVSLAGGWGELRLGRDLVPQYLNWVTFDPFSNNGVGAAQTFISGNSFVGVTAVRASNSIAYFLPSNLGGFYGQAMYYLGENNSGPATDRDGSGGGVRVGYAKGPFDVALAVGRTKYAAGNVTQSNIGGQWNFGVAKLMGQYSRDKNDALGATGTGGLIGTSIPVGVGEIRASASRYKVDTAGNPQTTRLALGYVHNLSRRTALYATIARATNNGGAAQALGGSVTAKDASSTGYDFGLRHSF